MKKSKLNAATKVVAKVGYVSFAGFLLGSICGQEKVAAACGISTVVCAAAVNVVKCGQQIHDIVIS